MWAKLVAKHNREMRWSREYIQCLHYTYTRQHCWCVRPLLKVCLKLLLGV